VDDPTTSGASRSLVARVARVLPAPPVVVFDEWVDPDALAEWMCPRPARCVGVRVDAVVGGVLHLDIEEPARRFSVTGHFLALDRPNGLRFTWSCSTWHDPSLVSEVVVSLAAHGADETLMTIEHRLLPADLVEQHQAGWAAIAAQLAGALTGRAEPA
jgi:uncharacterized protein YndB with AHSA1/START domain